ncbi:hypothetical protein CAOG_01665 [Capsaspora owczarzaki ATCC 30864]|uniref:Hemolysin III n=1 Tax=Capsaspora owczarzaki (strain ATCC 30864) TaxID=595528 RepID=A0A0D2WJP4_CAPO3|nr:hypothetical protein CAOG_01665 [Capsaspora owczarzaki ATCC 30864]KJE90340.1 hypothetical protein CAOG_001665 [Capsaspora owczarzaki ATCC 30864]|eukprot:XP_004364533.2 hypothetical protein CAOG_01665 [Capsaspora owczarzaki ATCC 30864]
MCFLCGFRGGHSHADNKASSTEISQQEQQQQQEHQSSSGVVTRSRLRASNSANPNPNPTPNSSSTSTATTATATATRVGWHKYRNDKFPGKEYVPTRAEHLANIWSHAVGILFGLFALWDMQRNADSRPKLVAAWTYGVSLIALFGVSTMYHVVFYNHWGEFLTRLFKLGDRVMIFVFVAGSYTPWILLVDLPDSFLWGETMLTVIWSIGFAGIAFSSFFTLTKRRTTTVEIIELGFYLGMGWIGAFVAQPMMASGVSGVALSLLVAGGLSFSIGVYFFRLDGIMPFGHTVWHIWVIIGCAFHYHAVCHHLLPSATHPSTHAIMSSA